MAYTLDCDTCDFGCSVDEEERAYERAIAHEREHGAHFVFIELTE